MKFKKVLGILMIMTLFVGLFSFLVSQAGLVIVIAAYTIALAVTAFLIIALYLIFDY